MNLPLEKKRKHLILSQTKLNLAKEIFGTKSEAETIEAALDFVILEAEKNEKAIKAHENLFKNKIEIRDVFN